MNDDRQPYRLRRERNFLYIEDRYGHVAFVNGRTDEGERTTQLHIELLNRRESCSIPQSQCQSE